MPSEALSGGNITPVTREGATVRRQVGPWTATVHSLLHYLADTGFTGSPRPRGYDDQGREILEYVEGIAGFISATDVRPSNLWSDQVLVEAARWLRRFHDATAGFQAPANAHWQLEYPDVDRHDVICHNDFAPYNCVFEDGHLKAVIDFDTAGPGPRIWDLAYAAYRFVPITSAETPPLAGVPLDARVTARLRIFCDVYGLEHDQRPGFPDVIQQRIKATITMLVTGAADGIEGYQRVLDEGGHIEALERDLAFVGQHVLEMQEALLAPR